MTESLKPSPYDQENKGLAQPVNFDRASGDRTSLQLAARRPLAIDLFCGLGGWTEGLLAEGYDVIGFDIEQHVYGEDRYPAQLVVQDVLTLHGSQFKTADLIVASPPCQEYSYMAMPWSLAKAKAAAIRADETGEAHKRLTALFDACFRIQREACEAAGRHVPMVVENVKGAQPWVGRAKWAFGSYFLWGDIPALMPIKKYHERQKVKAGEQWNVNRANFTGTRGWDDGLKNPGFRFDGSGRSFQSESVNRHVEGQKVTPQNAAGKLVHRRDGAPHTKRLTNAAEHLDEGKKLGGDWFHGYAPGVQGPRNHGSGSTARKAASAMIAKIPFALSSWIARCYLPERLADMTNATRPAPAPASNPGLPPC